MSFDQSEWMRQRWADPEERARLSKRISEGCREHFDGMSDEGRKEFCRVRSEALTGDVKQRIAEGVSRHAAGLSEEEREDFRQKVSASGVVAFENRLPEIEQKRVRGISAGLRTYHAGKSEEEKKEFSKKMLEAGKLGLAACGRRPNMPESMLQSYLDEYFPGEWKYVGDGQIWIGNRNPDFINVDGKKEILEVFGTYWHDEDEVEPLIEHYREFGFKCTILWEYECYLVESIERVLAGG